MKSSIKNQAEGAFHELRGKMKEIAGKLSDNPELQTEGTNEKVVGKVMGTMGQSKSAFGKSEKKS